MKRLFLILTLLGASLGLAQQTAQNHYWNLNFQSFAYLWINIGDLTFDLNADSVVGTAGYLSGMDYVYEPTINGLLACLNGETDSTYDGPSGTYNGATADSSTAPSCRFAPDIGSGGTSYDALYYDTDTSAYDNEADADLYILASGSGWVVDVAVTSGTVPSGVTLEAYPYAWDADETNLEAKDGSNPALGTDAVQVSTTSATLSSGASDKGYYVDGKYWAYLQPINYALLVDLSSVSLPIDTQLTVEYSVTAP